MPIFSPEMFFLAVWLQTILHFITKSNPARAQTCHFGCDPYKQGPEKGCFLLENKP